MELLSPAGNIDCVRAAVDSGADAVYFAGCRFGARSFAGNLSEDEIYAAVDYCHLFGVRAYITVNTLVFDREFKEADKLIHTITKAGADGVIVQDLGMLEYIKKSSPDIEIHASTQMTIHSADGVKALEKLGASRVVLSRELSVGEIGHISQNTDAELEVFVHGAMCMSFSGQCLMSSVIGGRSGNRGRCAQPCRLEYAPGGGSGKYKARQYLSLKDMSFAEHITELEKIGVSSLKIEGRMKGPEYVTAVVGIYRKLIDEKRKPTEAEIGILDSIFNRGGLTDGYFTGKTGKSMFAFNRPHNPYLKNEGAELPKPKTRPISMEAVITEGELPKLKLRCGSVCVNVTGKHPCQTAQNLPLTPEAAEQRLKKLGGTIFYADNVKVITNGSPFISASEINELRRDGVEALRSGILRPYKDKRYVGQSYQTEVKRKNELIGASISVSNINQYNALKDFGADRIYLPLRIAEENINELTEDLKRNNTKIVISPPTIITDTKRAEYKKRMAAIKASGFDRAEVSTVDAIELTEGFKRCGSFRLNVTNSMAMKRFADLGMESVCLSTELTAAQIRDINFDEKDNTTHSGNNKNNKNNDGRFQNHGCLKEAVVYGRIPLMICKNCIINNMDGCPCDGKSAMTDRTGRIFPIVRDGDLCNSIVLNSCPLYLADKAEVLDKMNVNLMRFIFTDETPRQCVSILREYGFSENRSRSESEACGSLRNGDFTRLRMLKSPLE